MSGVKSRTAEQCKTAKVVFTKKRRNTVQYLGNETAISEYRWQLAGSVSPYSFASPACAGFAELNFYLFIIIQDKYKNYNSFSPKYFLNRKSAPNIRSITAKKATQQHPPRLFFKKDSMEGVIFCAQKGNCFP
jgi:hypothetical protein